MDDRQLQTFPAVSFLFCYPDPAQHLPPSASDTDGSVFVQSSIVVLKCLTPITITNNTMDRSPRFSS